ncbi:atypical/ABC1/ABC1-B protein kinase [Coprinopsis cinerea okayama7|uniref:Atypical/ABC1/ABC1-B protein kinase n=1 Tax=Coprinopsis cinerea (strain Okayama-7 / 130 / ATCC MYA-4618 / FGSC 9003) TaxID=240176 RepID=D6RR08_COPC7|nr:atypical/ABC1/ABC1-B protein kinase [Coprinopsis cinerea okayama7\|eukprot:XP_002910085.1 atypical/ABC1/ABC1-B protein kinase [Coprinopsis cinerea okayama7\
MLRRTTLGCRSWRLPQHQQQHGRVLAAGFPNVRLLSAQPGSEAGGKRSAGFDGASGSKGSGYTGPAPRGGHGSTSNSYSTPPGGNGRSRLHKYSKRLVYTGLGLASLYAWDHYSNASAIFRNVRTLWTCLAITLDYKINFTPEKSDQIPQLHERVAERVYNLLTSNGGLYIKIGQAIGANAAVLPKPMQIKFASLFDDAPQVPYKVVEEVIINELGKKPSGRTREEGAFEVFDEKAVASASVAQVHKAKTWPRRVVKEVNGKMMEVEEEGEWVAVKIQKPSVAKQMEWDLAAYRFVMWMFENWAFDLPVYFVVDFISDHLRQELDFVREANNALQTAQFVEKEPSLRDRVHIPKVFPEYSSKRVLTAEWIDGVRLSDKAGIYRLMGEHEPEYNPIAPPEIDPLSATALVSTGPATTSPTTTTTTAFQYPAKPLKGGLSSVMKTMVELFSAQMFSWGWVHCDPHPGNVIVRPSPADPTKAQLVLIDHGLYVRVPEDFKRQWVHLWRSMLSGDYQGVKKAAESWGMGFPEFLASFTLMKPVSLKRGRRRKTPEEEMEEERKREERRKMSQYELSVLMKQKLKEFLIDTDRMPKVLIFLIRNMRMVQGNNQSFGSPVNRIKITADWASRSQFKNANLSVRERITEWWHHLVYRFIMFTIDFAFYKNKFFLWLNQVRDRLLTRDGEAPKKRKEGFEEEMERNMRDFAKDNLGLDVPASTFAG